ncbi:MAG: heme exporter protein CcmB [Chloroflexi bacterium]|nr:heme exporter protein CcmB [Chloroflexota bacterium]
MKITFVQAVMLILRRDLIFDIRNRQRLWIIFLFAILNTFVFSFALELQHILRREVVVGVFWTTILFASLLGFERQGSEGSRQRMSQAIKLAPLPRLAIFYGQLLANWLITLCLLLFTVLLQSGLFNARLWHMDFWLASLLGSLGLVTIGTTLTAMFSHISVRVGVMSVLLIPLILPILLTCVRFTLATQSELPVRNEWVALLVFQDIILLILTSWLYPHLIDE